MGGPPLISRRGFLLGGAGAVSMVAVGGMGAALPAEAGLVRPPGGQDESVLLGACIKCDRCRSACPNNVVDVAALEDGLLNARTPKLNFRKGYCDFCQGHDGLRCVASCPTGAISAGFDPWSDKLGMAVVDESECLLYRSGSHYCSKPCIDACEYDAFRYDEDTGQLVVAEDRCNGCGACEHACISSSYGSFTGSARRGVNVEKW